MSGPSILCGFQDSEDISMCFSNGWALNECICSDTSVEVILRSLRKLSAVSEKRTHKKHKITKICEDHTYNNVSMHSDYGRCIFKFYMQFHHVDYKEKKPDITAIGICEWIRDHSP